MSFNELELLFSGGQADAHEVSAVHLIHALEGLQRSFHLLAMQHEDVELRQRVRVSRDIDEKYAILLSPPQKGSVKFGLTLGDPTASLVAPEMLSAVGESFLQCCDAIMRGDRPKLRRVVPDSSRLRRLIEAFRKALPRRGSGVEMTLLSSTGQPLLASPGLEKRLVDLLQSPTSEPMVQTVTGTLKAVAFDRRQHTLLYPVTRRELRCFYDEGAEELLLMNPRELIQVTGTVVLDPEDNPMEIQDVQDIREVDLSPFRVGGIDVTSGSFVLVPPLVIEPELDESLQFILLSYPPLGIDLAAPTREQLYDALIDELDMLWRNYGAAPDDILTPGAQRLKSAIRRQMVAVG